MLSVVIPCLNDQEGLRPTVEALEQSLQPHGISYELVIVDDGSSPALSRFPTKARTQWLRHERNRGYGAALRTGIRQAQGDAILIIDSDGTYPAEQAGNLYEMFVHQGADMIIGARQSWDAQIPLARRPAKWFLNRFATVLVGEAIADLNSGFRVFKRSLFERFESLFPDGFSFTSTLTFAALVDGFKVLFQPIEYRGRMGKSKIRPVQDTYNFFLLIIRSALYFNPLRILLPVAIALVILATALLLYGKFVLGQIPDITVTVLYMLGIQTGLLAFMADVVVRRSHPRQH